MTNAIANIYYFSDGDIGVNINDGGDDMYDGGNYLETDLGGYIEYSDNTIVNSTNFGPSGRYFTRKVDGLFLLAADMDGVGYFQITGNNGADSDGSADGSILETTYQGVTYRGFVKRVNDGGGDPSINHLIIIPDDEDANHEFSTDTNDDYHKVFNLGGTTRLYYLLFAGYYGEYYDDEAVLNVMNAFLNALSLIDPVTVQPTSGTTPVGESSEVTVTFNATLLAGGDYPKELLITSNDPDEEFVTVPATLHVTGAPDIAISGTAVNFGQVFVGSSKNDTIVVQNVGAETLNVSSVYVGSTVKSKISGSNFNVNVGSFQLAPNGQQDVVVTYSPTNVAINSDVLTLESDDPDEGTVAISLSGEGIEPPVIEVSPESLSASLYSGDVTTQTLTISNTGVNNLTFSISVETVAPPEESRVAMKTLSTRRYEPQSPRVTSNRKDGREKTLHRERDRQKQLTGKSQLAKQLFAKKATTSAAPNVLAFSFTESGGDLLTAAGIEFDLVDEEGFYETNFSAYDVLFVASYANLTPLYDRQEDIANFVNNGGGLVVLDQQVWDWMPVSLDPSGGWCGDNVTIVAPDHPIMNGITSEGLSNFGCSIHTLFPEYDSRLEVLAVGTPDDVTMLKMGGGNMPLILAGDIGSGRVVISGQDNEHRLEYGPEDDGIEIVYNMVKWAGENLFSINPTSGVVSPGNNVEIIVTFNTAGLAPGEYDANINVSSNDPLNPLVVVPAHLEVISAPNLALRDTAIEFGTVVVGEAPQTRTLIVSNTGTDTLVVSDLSLSGSSFSADTTAFDVAPGESKSVEIAFSSETAGSFNGTLTITSNDPTDGTKMVSLHGTAKTAEGAASALSFDGDNDYVEVPDANSLDLTINYTIEVWIYPYSFGWLNGIVSKYQTGGANGYILRLTSSEPYTGIGFDEMETDNGILTAGQWYHIAAVNDNGTRILYVNGNQVPLYGKGALEVQANSDPLGIGVDYFERYFNGIIDEVRIWNVARSEDEIRANMHRRLSGDENLVGYWRFDEGAGTTTKDASSAGNNGTLKNGPTWETSTAPLGTGTTTSVSEFQTGTIDLGSVTLEATDPFDEPVDLYATHIMVGPNDSPEGSTTVLDDQYWIINMFESPPAVSKSSQGNNKLSGASFVVNLTFDVPTSFTNNGTADPSLYTMYSRSSTSEGSWSAAVEEASALTTTTVKFDGISSFSQFALGTNDPLPIQLMAFTAIETSAGVELQWSTATETNNYGFYVERKAEGEANFTELPNSFVKGAGTTLEEQHYSWTDKEVTPGTYYYRLRQADLNGDFAYSHEIRVVVSGVVGVWDDGLPLEFKLLQNFPNPFNPVTEIRYAIKDAGFVVLKVYNVLGQEVATLVNEQKQPGRYAANFDAGKLASGMYVYRLTSRENIVTKQMMLIK